MSKSSEDVLLQVPHVKYKKYEGVLFVMSERIGWMPGSKSSFSVVHKYTEIKSQKISPDGKSKIQLQIVLHDGTTSTTFHFLNPAGPEQSLKDREAVKECLVELLPKFKRRINKELEEKNRTLSENPGLLQLYKDLVITQIISAEEFWSGHAASYMKEKQAVKQEVGVSGSFLAEIKPQADGCNGLKYNLTPDIIESIFKTYPAVKKKHADNVPTKMTEQEFWTKFFQSHYFHRDRVHAQGTKDIFTECARDDDKSIRKQLQIGVNECVADITKFDDNTLSDGFGGNIESVLSATSQNIVHQNIIKRFNQHSIMVMETAEVPTEHSNGDLPHATEAATNPRKRLNDKTVYQDLEEPGAKKPAQMNLSRVDRYLTGPTPAASQDYLTSEELRYSRANLQAELKSWSESRNPPELSSSAAVSVLGDLSPGGAMMVANRQDALAEQCPLNVQADLRQLYASLCELIRHFWAAFPPTTPQLQEKARKMYETLQKFQAMKVRPFETEVDRRYSAGGGHITQHINAMLDAADRKYKTWANRTTKKF